MGKRTPWNEARCDQLKAVLRDANGLLSTDDVAAALPDRLRWMPCLPRYHDDPDMALDGEQCDGKRHTWVSPVMPTEIYQTLRSLERERLVERVWHTSDRRVFWRWSGPIPDDDIAHLEAVWADS